MNSAQAQRSEAGDARKLRSFGAELDRLVEGELAALLAEGDAAAASERTPTDQAERFIERAVSFLAGRPDRQALLARLQAALPEAQKAPPPMDGEVQTKPE